MVLKLFQDWVQRSLGDQDNRRNDHVIFRRDYEHERVLEISVCSLRIMYSRFFLCSDFCVGERGEMRRAPMAPDCAMWGDSNRACQWAYLPVGQNALCQPSFVGSLSHLSSGPRGHRIRLYLGFLEVIFGVRIHCLLVLLVNCLQPLKPFYF